MVGSEGGITVLEDVYQLRAARALLISNAVEGAPLIFFQDVYQVGTALGHWVCWGKYPGGRVRGARVKACKEGGSRWHGVHM